eukprot:1152685-Pelagomonas_calceolata.AAC.6
MQMERTLQGSKQIMQVEWMSHILNGRDKFGPVLPPSLISFLQSMLARANTLHTISGTSLPPTPMKCVGQSTFQGISLSAMLSNP